MRRDIPFSICLALAALACNTDPAKDKSKATVAEPVQVAPATPATGAVEHAFSSSDSKLDIVGAKVTKKHDGSFGNFNGTIKLVDGQPEKSSVNAEIDMASVSMDAAKLTDHLKSPDFFDVQKFPKARFTSTQVKPGGEKGATHTITGNLELHGVTKSITFPANVRVKGDAVDVDAEFAINRKDFGIVYPGAPDDLIKDDVLIKLQIRGKRKA
jgi:polyisoprenoid-binding protein YceI